MVNKIQLPWEPTPKLKPLFPKPSGVTVPKGCPLQQQWLENIIADSRDLNAPIGRVETIPGARIKGELIGNIDGISVYAVDANAVNLAYEKELRKANDLNNWVDAGNQQRWTWMPDQFWINRVLAADITERAHCIVHEATERRMMKINKMPYATAHDHANEIEVQLMHQIDPCPACGNKKEKCSCKSENSKKKINCF